MSSLFRPQSICLVSPYIPNHVGGGERYLFDVARTAVALGHRVSIAVPEHLVSASTDIDAIRRRYEDFMADPLNGVQFVASPLGSPAHFWRKLWWTRQFDCCYAVTDGSFFLSLASRNILHIQMPFHQQPVQGFARWKLQRWPIRNANSAFTRSIVEQSWKVPIQFVHYPMVALEAELKAHKLTHIPKEKIILHVGRFFRQLHSKRQDVLVAAFRQLCQQYPDVNREWKLVLVGPVEDGDYAQEVKQLATGLPVEIYHQLPRSTLLQWYQRASIYWHATGFGVDAQEFPEKMEHFGISTVEAMAAGAVPIVYGQGGQLEVVGANLKDCLWQTQEECVTITAAMINDHQLRHQTAVLAQKRALDFGPEKFKQTLAAMIDNQLEDHQQ